MNNPLLLKVHIVMVMLAFCVFLQFASAQELSNDAAMTNIHGRLSSVSRRTYNKPLLLVGEIITLGPVFMGVCKQAVSETVDFKIERIIWGTPDGSQLRTGYINCTHTPLPVPPFTLNSRVIVYCEQQHSVKCLTPVEFTEQRLATINSWLANLRQSPAQTSPPAPN
jgi:hypothetical protein